MERTLIVTTTHTYNYFKTKRHGRRGEITFRAINKGHNTCYRAELQLSMVDGPLMLRESLPSVHPGSKKLVYRCKDKT